jgi:sigma-E factor negative regulatory protein RseA
MKDTLSEQVSALVDDELETAEQALLLRQLTRDASLCRQFARYQLVSDALKDNLPERIDPGFHMRIQAALQDEAAPHVATNGLHKGRLVKPLAGLAVAASFAVVAVLSLQSVRESTPQSAPAVASAPAPADYIRAEGQPPATSATAPARDLDAYLVNHNEFASNQGMRGMLPYVRLLGQGEQPGSKEDSE